VALAAIKGDRTLVPLAEQFDVHPDQISTWKDQLLEGAAEVFATSSSARPSTPEVDIKALHAMIGRPPALSKPLQCPPRTSESS
jgi:transposase